MTVNAIVTWSIYIQCSDKSKLKRVHLPAIEEVIGHPESDWIVMKDEDAPGEFRLVKNYNMGALDKELLTIGLLKTAFNLVDGEWSFQGLSSLSADRRFYMMATYDVDKPSPSPPAITSILLEVKEGELIQGKTDLEMVLDRCVFTVRFDCADQADFFARWMEIGSDRTNGSYEEKTTYANIAECY